MIERMISIKGPGKILDLTHPVIMGIVNLTPDSFYAKSRAMDMGLVVEKVGKMIEEGAKIIDLGAVSTRPGSVPPTVAEEMNRLTAPLMAIRAAFPEILISVDTFRADILKSCLDIGINVINDISGGEMDEHFLEVVAESKLPYVIMHMQGLPINMQDDPKYDDIILHQLKYFDQKIHECKKLGIHEVIIDPGFGFGKTVAHNYQILKSLESYKIFNRPILVGISRKSMINAILNTTPSQALNGTTALHMLAIQNGANILRVHDVKEAMECIRLFGEYSKA